jgi:hypothetical protein
LHPDPASAATTVFRAWTPFGPPRGSFRNDLGDRELDERQIQVRNSGYFTAYQILAPMVALLVIYPQIAVEFELWLPTTDDERSAVIWCTLGFLITLPGSILAWTEPDPR